MERLSGLDASFLYLETPSNHMHVAATMVYDPSTVPGGYDFEKVKEMIRSRLHLVQQFRRRLVTVPFQLHHPVWVEDGPRRPDPRGRWWDFTGGGTRIEP